MWTGFFFLAADSDMFVTKRVTYSDLVPVEGRAIFNYSWNDKTADYIDASIALRSDGPFLKTRAVSATPPFIFSTEVCALMRADLEREHSMPWALALSLAASVYDLKWTEVHLHHLTALTHGLWDKLFVEAQPEFSISLYNSHNLSDMADFWNRWKSLDLLRFFNERPSALFGVMHSTYNVDGYDVWKKIAALVAARAGNLPK